MNTPVPIPSGESWKTAECYGTTRAVEFAMRALSLRLGTVEEILEYVGEAEHGEGDDYWSNFNNLSEALEDFKLYLENCE